jgi:hypothetical protein
VRRADRPALLVAWLRRDGLTGEDEPPLSVSWPWRGSSAHAVDAYGRPVAVNVDNGNVSLPVSLTPIFVDQKAQTVDSMSLV